MSSPTSPNQPKKELSNELRMVIAFVLMGIIILGVPYVYRRTGFYKPEPVPVAKDAAAKNAAAKPGAMSSEVKSQPASALPSDAPAPSGAVAAAAESEWTLDTVLYHIVFSNRGGVIKSWTLNNFKDTTDKHALELVNQKGGEKFGFPFSYDFNAQKPSTDLNKALWVAHPGGDGASISYDYSDGNTTAHKSFVFQRDGYIMQFSDDVRLGNAGIPHLVQWRGGFGDMAVNAAAGHQETIHYDSEKKKLITNAAKAGKDQPEGFREEGPFSFAGIQDQYFTAAFLPQPNTRTQAITFQDHAASSADASDQPYPGVAVGGDSRNQLGLYVGPKELSALAKVNPKLQDIIDWGWFGFIAKPLFFALQWLNNGFVHNYGWSIVLLTILISIALFPLRLANLKSMRKMQQLQPELARINDKYKGISMSDPRASQKQQETMALYKVHGVNPMGGCVPMLIQLPFLWAFYKVLSVTIEMRHASWLWVTDLSQPEHLAIRLLPLIMVASSFLMQKMTPVAGGDPNQQKVMQFMPLMWGFFFWNASSGLVLYWLTSNLVGIAQQWFFNKTSSTAVVVTAPAGRKSIPSKDGRKRA